MSTEKIVLVVDDEESIRNMVKTRLMRLSAGFIALTASNGFEAVKILERGGVSLVITDVKMPKMDGMELLAYIMQRHPSIPCILVTGYGSPQVRKQATELGAVEFISKPFDMAYLGDRTQAILKSQEEGGVVHDVALSVFVHLIEMEGKTCTIRAKNKKAGGNGSLFFNGGELFDARSGSLTGADAAYEIFSWEKADIQIQNSCHITEKKINRPLQAVILETMRLQDEVGPDEETTDESTESSHAQSESIDYLERTAPVVESIEILTAGDVMVSQINEQLPAKLKEGVDRVAADPYWDSFINLSHEMGKSLNTGNLSLVSLTADDGADFILVPGEETVSVSVWKKSLRETLRDVLCKITVIK